MTEPLTPRCHHCSKPLTGHFILVKVSRREPVPGRGTALTSEPQKFCNEQCAIAHQERKKP